MVTVIYLAAALAGALAAYFVLAAVAGAYLKFRGTRVITCPETTAPAAVRVDAKHAALTAVLHEPRLRVNDCSRWPEHRACGQECLRQIELGPEECLARTMLAKWYEGKACVLCGKAFGDICWLEHRPALMSRERITLEWRELRPEQLPETLATHLPVCWNCHVAEMFRRLYPELVLERPTRTRGKWPPP